MKNKIRLIMGQPLDAPFANSIPALMLLAVLFIAGSVLLWSDAGDTLFLSRGRADVREITVESCTVAGQDSYVPRLEIVSADGKLFTLLESQVGRLFEAVAAELESGDEVTLRLSRKGRVLEVQEGDLVHLDFEQSKRAAGCDVFVSGGAALLFDLLAALLIIRCAMLKLNRKSTVRLGPAR